MVIRDFTPFIAGLISSNITDLAGVKVSINNSSTLTLRVKPVGFYGQICQYFVGTGKPVIYPRDNETRMFLKEIPITQDDFIHWMRHPESSHTLLADGTILSISSSNYEQAFIRIYCICFALFVEFFLSYLEATASQALTPAQIKAFIAIKPILSSMYKDASVSLPRYNLVQDMVYTGKLLVASKLVDSVFGNISCRVQDRIYISQTGSYLDQLENAIVTLDLDGHVLHGGKPSSEVDCHLGIYRGTQATSVLHVHPKFAVILSMFCKTPCLEKDRCQLDCTVVRQIVDIPVVSGLSGRGPHSLSVTVAPALQDTDAVMVCGHGLFVRGQGDFLALYQKALQIEIAAMKGYFDSLNAFL